MSFSVPVSLSAAHAGGPSFRQRRHELVPDETAALNRLGGSRSGSSPRRPACRKGRQSRKARVISGLCSPRKRAFGPPPRKRGPSKGRIERGGFAPSRSVAPARRGSSRHSHCGFRRDEASGTVSAPLLVPYRDTGDTGARSRQSAGTKVDRPGPIQGPGGRMPSRPDDTTPAPFVRGLREGRSYQDLSHRSCDPAASHRCDRTDRASCCGASLRPVSGGGTDARLHPPGKSGFRSAALLHGCHGGAWPEGMSLQTAGSVRLLLWPRTSSSRPRSSIRMNRSQMICISGENPPLRLK